MKALSNNLVFFLMKQVWRYAGDRRPIVVLDYALLVIAYIILSAQPVVLAKLIGAAQKGGPEAMHDALLWSAVYGSTIVFFWLFNYPARVIERRYAYDVFRNYTRAMYRMITEMPLRWHQDHHSGDIISRVGKASNALYVFAQGQFMIFQLSVRFLASIAALAIYSGWAAFASAAASLVIFFTIGRFDKRIMAFVIRTNDAGHRLGSAVQDYIGNVVTVLALRLQGDTDAEIGRRFLDMKPALWPEINVSEAKWATVGFLLIATQAAIVGSYIAAALHKEQPLDMGAVVAIFQCLTVVNLMFFQGMQTLDQLMRQHADMHSVDGILADHAGLAVAVPESAARSWQKIAIESLAFTHREGEDVLHHLRDINLEIEKGRKIALIGASGAGKTTLLTLLRGLYDPQHVRLRIDGDVFENLKPLAAFTTLVPQDSEIFENTILYNLTLGTSVAEETVKQMTTITTFDEVAAKLPHGMETDIRERGVNLSGGQKQRLALARGLIAARGPSLLLLDEPTSSVDLPTESIIFDRLFAAFAGKAIIASVHRLHLLPRFDHIVFMQDGAVLEQGSFLELLARHGAFYELWQRHLAQSAGGAEKEAS